MALYDIDSTEICFALGLGVYCPSNTCSLKVILKTGEAQDQTHHLLWFTPPILTLVYTTYSGLHHLLWFTPHTLVYTTYFGLHHILWFTPPTLVYTTYSGLHHILWFTPPTLVYPHLLWFTQPILVYPHLLWLTPPTLVYTTHSGLHHPLWFTNRIEPRLRNFRPGLTQTNQYNHRSRLKA